MGIDDLSDVRIVCFYYEYVVLIYLVPRMYRYINIGILIMLSVTPEYSSNSSNSNTVLGETN